MLRNSVSCLFKLNTILWVNNPCSKLFMSILVIFFVDLYHDLFSHSQTDGHLGWFQIFAFTKSPAMDITCPLTLGYLYKNFFKV